jgi:predicted adenylyl cyclase CyaB
MEIEVKAKTKDLKVVRQRLIKLGARFIKSVHQIDTYYSLYKRPFTKRRGSMVRVRHNKNENFTTFEFDNAKNDIAATEDEVIVSDYRTIKIILRKMKAKVETVVDKKREYFMKGRLEIVLDRVKGLGNYMEIEILGKDTKANRDKILTFYKKLKVDENDLIIGSRYPEMMLKKKGKNFFAF